MPIEPSSLASPATPHARSQAVQDVQTVQTDLAALVPTYSPLLFRIAYSVLRTHDEAEDVVQEAFLRLLRHPQPLSVIRDLRLWLIRIAWNLALDRRRRIRPGQMDEQFAASLVARDLPADAALSQAQDIRAVLDALERLPNAERHALLLSAVDELGTPEIAQVLERSESAVRALLSRARARLRQRPEQKGVTR